VLQQSEAIHSFLLGEIELRRRNQGSAIGHFSRAKTLFKDPTPSIDEALALLFLSEGRIKESLQAVDDALAHSEGTSNLLLLRASLLHVLAHQDTELIDQARKAYADFFVSDPSHFPARILAGSLELLSSPARTIIAAPSQLVIQERVITTPLADLSARSPGWSDTAQASTLAQLERALSHFTVAARERPANPLPWYLSGRALEQLGRLGEAERALEEGLRVDPKNPAIFVDLIRVLSLQGAPYAAIRERVSRVAEKDPDHPAANRVLRYLDLDSENSAESITRLAGLSPSPLTTADIRFRLALGAMRSQDPQSALRELRLVLAEEPENADARYNLAAILSSTGDTGAAVQELERIPEDSPLFSKARMFAAFLLRQRADLAGAEAALRRALGASPDDPQMSSFLVVILREAGKKVEARGIIEQQLGRDASNEKLLYTYGTLLTELGEQDLAVAQMERVIEINPNQADALNFISFSLAERGVDLDRAEALIHRALKIRPRDPYFLDTLGWIHYKRGDYGSAEELLRVAAQTSGDDPEILEHYGDVLLRRSRLAEAATAYRTALEKIQDSRKSDNEATRIRLEQKLSEVALSQPPKGESTD
jgi:tetratricopeptide (TPR) repeat protein